MMKMILGFNMKVRMNIINMVRQISYLIVKEKIKINNNNNNLINLQNMIMDLITRDTSRMSRMKYISN